MSLGSFTLNWRPEAFKAALVAQLVSNAEIVGEFVETEARRRLLAIPDINVFDPVKHRQYVGGAAYRQYVASLLANTITSDAQSVVIRVGVSVGRGGTKHGLYIETGSRLAPAHPFLRPAVFDNAQKIVLLLANK